MLSLPGMTLPRRVLSETFYMLTRRCSQRQFLMTPDEETNNAFIYCIAEAAQRFEIELILAQQMSNHHHTVLFDRHGRIIEFMAHFHKMLAKCQNALRGRWENMWSTDAPCLVELVETSDVIDKIIYVATNPVLDNLVDRVDHWPGAKTTWSMLRRTPLRAHRPSHFFRDGNLMPATIELAFTVPPELGDHTEVLAVVSARIAETEVEVARKRFASGTRIVGRRTILRQSWRDSPSSHEPRRNLRPRVAARAKWERLAALGRNHEFLCAYREARKAWLTDSPIPFPAGTYWLARFANVPVVALPD